MNTHVLAISVFQFLIWLAFQTYLPEDSESGDRTSIFLTANHKSYNAEQAGVPPSEVQTAVPKKISAKKASFFGRIFNIQRFKSSQSVKSLIPNYAPP